MNDNDWQPIETAPKDGTELFGWNKYIGRMIIRWDAPINFVSEQELNEIGEEAAEKYDWFCADFIAGIRLDGRESPTLWMPLPKPPKED